MRVECGTTMVLKNTTEQYHETVFGRCMDHAEKKKKKRKKSTVSANGYNNTFDGEKMSTGNQATYKAVGTKKQNEI